MNIVYGVHIQVIKTRNELRRWNVEGLAKRISAIAAIAWKSEGDVTYEGGRATLVRSERMPRTTEVRVCVLRTTGSFYKVFT